MALSRRNVKQRVDCLTSSNAVPDRRCGSLQVLLVRHTPEELEAMVAVAVELIDGAAEAVDFARQRRELCKVVSLPCYALATTTENV